MQQSSNDQIHWKRTTNLMLVHLFIWFFFGYIIHMFVNFLNQFTVPILKFPLGFYMGAQGSLVIYVVMIFFYAIRMNKLDKEYDVAEGEG